MREAHCSEPNKGPVAAAGPGSLKPLGRFGEQDQTWRAILAPLPFLHLGIPASGGVGPMRVAGSSCVCTHIHSPLGARGSPPLLLTQPPQEAGRAVALTFSRREHEGTWRLREASGAQPEGVLPGLVDREDSCPGFQEVGRSGAGP